MRPITQEEIEYTAFFMDKLWAATSEDMKDWGAFSAKTMAQFREMKKETHRIADTTAAPKAKS